MNLEARSNHGVAANAGITSGLSFGFMVGVPSGPAWVSYVVRASLAIALAFRFSLASGVHEANAPLRLASPRPARPAIEARLLK